MTPLNQIDIIGKLPASAIDLRMRTGSAKSIEEAGDADLREIAGGIRHIEADVLNGRQPGRGTAVDVFACPGEMKSIDSGRRNGVGIPRTRD